MKPRDKVAGGLPTVLATSRAPQRDIEGIGSLITHTGEFLLALPRILVHSRPSNRRPWYYFNNRYTLHQSSAGASNAVATQTQQSAPIQPPEKLPRIPTNSISPRRIKSSKRCAGPDQTAGTDLTSAAWCTTSQSLSFACTHRTDHLITVLEAGVSCRPLS